VRATRLPRLDRKLGNGGDGHRTRGALDRETAARGSPTHDARRWNDTWRSLLNSHRASLELAAFLDAGEPPVYFDFGSNRAPEDLSRVMIKSARALGRRAIVSRGWADLSLVDDEPTAWPSARSTSRRCSNEPQSSSTTAVRAPRPRPCREKAVARLLDEPRAGRLDSNTPRCQHPRLPKGAGFWPAPW
jgi:hypothetical protein